MPIRKIKARQIFDSLGQPTVEVDVVTDIGLLRSSVPCGSLFPGENEAKEIRDDDEAAYNGRSVFKGIRVYINYLFFIHFHGSLAKRVCYACVRCDCGACVLTFAYFQAAFEVLFKLYWNERQDTIAEIHL